MIKLRGVTLIELIVVISIIAILAVIGYPSYQTYLIESRRTDAINGLRSNQLLVEAWMQNHSTTPDSSDVPLATVSPAGFYDLTYVQDSSDSYQLIATAVTTSSQNDDTGCTTITLVSQMDNTYPIACR